MRSASSVTRRASKLLTRPLENIGKRARVLLARDLVFLFEHRDLSLDLIENAVVGEKRFCVSHHRMNPEPLLLQTNQKDGESTKGQKNW